MMPAKACISGSYPGLSDQRAAFAEGAEIAIDQLRLLGGQLSRSEPVPRHDAGPQVLDHRVRPIEDEPLQACDFLGVPEIDRDAALAPVQRMIGRGGAIPERRAPAARVIAAVRILDLDHLGAEFGEDEPRIGRGYAVPYLDDRDPRQGLFARHDQLRFRLTWLPNHQILTSKRSVKRSHGGQVSVTGISWAECFSVLAARFESRIAVVDAAGSLSYAGLFRKAASLADMLLASGVQPGEPVATFLRNGIPAVWASYGVTLSGAAETALNPGLGKADREHCIAVCKTRHVVTSVSQAELFRAPGVVVHCVEEVGEAVLESGRYPRVPLDPGARSSSRRGRPVSPRALSTTSAGGGFPTCCFAQHCPSPRAPRDACS